MFGEIQGAKSIAISAQALQNVPGETRDYR